MADFETVAPLNLNVRFWQIFPDRASMHPHPSSG